MSRLDAMIATEYTDRDGNTKTQWTNIGTAWPAKSGVGYSITLKALPIPSLSRDGKLEVRIVLMEPRERDAAPRGNGTPARNNRAPVDDLGDDIPFAFAGEPSRRSVFP